MVCRYYQKLNEIQADHYLWNRWIDIARYWKGYREFVIGIGGSATNDAGVGMLQALGARFLNKDGAVLGEGGEICIELPLLIFLPFTLHLKILVHDSLWCTKSLLWSGRRCACFCPAEGGGWCNDREIRCGYAVFFPIDPFNYRKRNHSRSRSRSCRWIRGGILRVPEANLKSGIDTVLDLVHFDSLLALIYCSKHWNLVRK